MKRITLKNSEQTKITNIVEQYRHLESHFNDIQSQLKNLDNLKEQLLASLDKIRAEETIFFEKLSKKYGEGKMDIMTMEYLTN